MQNDCNVKLKILNKEFHEVKYNDILEFFELHSHVMNKWVGEILFIGYFFPKEIKLYLVFGSDLLEVTLISTAKGKSLLQFS